MPDKAPILMRKHLGGLYPASLAAKKALDALDNSGSVKVEFKRTRGNNSRLALYWVVLAKVAPVLSDMCEGDALDENLLHRTLKDRRGLYKTIILPSGEVIKDYDSISFHKMPENERNDFIQWAFETMAKWIGVSVLELTAKD
jgi:hypothetical protein